MVDLIDSSDTQKTLITAGIACGIIYGILKRKAAIGIFGYALGFGLVAMAASTVVTQLTK